MDKLDLQQIYNALKTFAYSYNLDEAEAISVITNSIHDVWRMKYGDRYKIDVSLHKGCLKIIRHVIIVEHVNDFCTEILMPASAEHSELKIGDETTEDITHLNLNISSNILSKLKLIIQKNVDLIIKNREYNTFITQIDKVFQCKIVKIEGRNLIVSVGNSYGVIPAFMTLVHEVWNVGSYIYCRLYEVNPDKLICGYQLHFERKSIEFIKALCSELIFDIGIGNISIKAVGRIPGNMSVIAIESNLSDQSINAISAAIGQQQSNLQLLKSALQSERIRFIQWYDNIYKMVQSLFSTVSISNIIVSDDLITFHVAESQIGLALGSRGMNAILAAQILGKKVSILPKTEKSENSKLDQMFEESMQE